MPLALVAQIGLLGMYAMFLQVKIYQMRSNGVNFLRLPGKKTELAFTTLATMLLNLERITQGQTIITSSTFINEEQIRKLMC